MQAWVAQHNDRPTLFVDGEPQMPVFYALTHAFGGRFSWEEVPTRNLGIFASAGFRLFQVDVHFQDLWLPDRSDLDMTTALRQIRGVTAVRSDAAVVLRVHVNAPYWWNERHPDECTRYADGPVEDERYGPPFHYEDGDNRRALRASIASALWLREAGERLAEFCARLQQAAEGENVVGLHIAGGIYGEWHYWGFIAHEPDTGLAMTARFRRWLAERYGTDDRLRKAWQGEPAGARSPTIAGATVPSCDERAFTSHGLFRDPARERRVIDYFTCQQETVADALEHFCSIVKSTWAGPIVVGVFYGYFFGTFGRQAVGGHLCLRGILESPSIDYLSAPQSYTRESRAAGGSGTSRGLIESARLHGKLWLDEIDNGYQQVDAAADFVRFRPRNDLAYLEILARSAVQPILRGGGFWLYDFGASKGYGWWDSPAYLRRISSMMALFGELLARPHRSDADVLYVWSMETFYHLQAQPSILTTSLVDQWTEDALRCGVAGDHVYDFDLDRVDFRQYRAVVLMNLFCLSDGTAGVIRDRAAGDGRTIIWNYLPGITDGERFSLERTGRLTGFRLEDTELPDDVELAIEASDGSAGTMRVNACSPLARITGHGSRALGRIAGASHVVIAEREAGDHRVVLATVPLQSPGLFRYLLERAGCHVYARCDEVIAAACGLVLVHAAALDGHEIRLRGGRTVQAAGAERQTVLIDAVTGAVVFPAELEGLPTS